MVKGELGVKAAEKQKRILREHVYPNIKPVCLGAEDDRMYRDHNMSLVEVTSPIVGYKKARTFEGNRIHTAIIFLVLPVETRIMMSGGTDASLHSKARADQAYVQEIRMLNNSKGLFAVDDIFSMRKKSWRQIYELYTDDNHSHAVEEAYSLHMGPRFRYRPGKIVRPRRAFSLNPWTCDSGIHFFFNHILAVAY